MPPIPPNVTPVPQPRPQQAQQAQPQLGQVIGTQMPVSPAPTPQQAADLEQSWLEVLNRPDVRSGLMQFALNMFQPVQPGQSELGHIAAAAGAGGEQIGRVQALGREEEQRAEENRQAQERLRLQGEEVDVRREGVEARREATASQERISKDEIGARERLQEASDAAALERVQKQVGARYAEIEALNERLDKKIAADKELRAAASDSAIWEAAMKHALEGVDLDIYDFNNPDDVTAYNTAMDTAAAKAMQTVQSLQQARAMYNDPSLVPDSTFDEAFQRLPDNPQAVRDRLAGAFPSEIERIEAAQARHQERMAAAQTGQGGEQPPPAGPAVTTPTTPTEPTTQPPPSERPGYTEELRRSETEAERQRIQEMQEKQPLRFAALNNDVAKVNEMLAGTTLDQIDDQTFGTLWRMNMADTLVRVFGQELVEGRAVQLGLTLPGQYTPPAGS